MYQWPVGQAVKTAASSRRKHGFDSRTGHHVLVDKTRKNLISCYCNSELVLIAVRVHPFPSRTRKLSSLAPKILVWRRTGKIGNANIGNRTVSRLSCLLYEENHTLGEWFKKKPYGDDADIKTPFAIIKVRSANCTKNSKGRSSNE